MYYIYHIPGNKIGCSINPKLRVKLQKHSNYEILEQYEDINIASKREIELQKEFGYKVDTVPYSHSFKIAKIGSPIGLFNSHKNNSKAVKAFNYITKEFVGEYVSLCEACRQLNISQGRATWVIKGKRNHTGGYYFLYA